MWKSYTLHLRFVLELLADLRPGFGRVLYLSCARPADLRTLRITQFFQRGRGTIPFFVSFIYCNIQGNTLYYLSSRTFDRNSVFMLPSVHLTFRKSGAKMETAHPGGSNSAGRVRPCQGRCRRFESGLPLQFLQRVRPGLCSLWRGRSCRLRAFILQPRTIPSQDRTLSLFLYPTSLHTTLLFAV